MCTGFSCHYFLRKITIYIMFTLYLVFKVSRDSVVGPHRIRADRSLSDRNHLPLQVFNSSVAQRRSPQLISDRTQPESLPMVHRCLCSTPKE